MKVAVVAHTGKTLGGGLVELRRLLERSGVAEPLWFEVPKAKKAPKKVRAALKGGADLVLAWGGDGMVRRCLGELAGTDVPLGILPAGTANLLAANLGVPDDLDEALVVALGGHARRLDIGRIGDERFAVMAGVGFDAAMIRDADDLKERLGRAAYLVSGARNLPPEAFGAKVSVDGVHWFEGRAGCLLLGNVGSMFGGLEAFPDAKPDDGLLEIGVVTAEGIAQWARTIARTAVGRPDRSRFVETTRGRTVVVELDRKVRYELDGGERGKIRRFEVDVEPGAVQVCVPRLAELRRSA